MEFTTHVITIEFLVSQVGFVGSLATGSFLSPVKYPIFPLPQIYIRTDFDQRRKFSPFRWIIMIWTEYAFELELRLAWDSEGFDLWTLTWKVKIQKL